jgi:hypothetical protein
MCDYLLSFLLGNRHVSKTTSLSEDAPLQMNLSGSKSSEHRLAPTFVFVFPAITAASGGCPGSAPLRAGRAAGAPHGHGSALSDRLRPGSDGSGREV